MAKLYNNCFYGEEVSPYGLERGYIDYRCLAKCVDSIVLCNDIVNLFYSDINGQYVEPEQENGFIDNTKLIEELQEQIENIDGSTEEGAEKIKELEEEIEELEREENEPPEVYQWYIISYNGADFLKRFTDEIVYYIPVLDIYVWGVTHWGTSWDYVLTDIEIEEDSEQ